MDREFEIHDCKRCIEELEEKESLTLADIRQLERLRIRLEELEN